MGEIVLFTPFCLYHCLTSFPPQMALKCFLRCSGFPTPCFPRQQHYLTFDPLQEAPRRQDQIWCPRWRPFSNRLLFSLPLQSRHPTPTCHAALADSP